LAHFSYFEQYISSSAKCQTEKRSCILNYARVLWIML